MTVHHEAPAQGDATRVALSVAGVSVTFGQTQALNNASLAVRPGSIHAILGSNGSGKSTLIKVLAGVQVTDGDGWIEAGGQRVSVHGYNSETAWDLGLRFVHQNVAVFHGMSVAENFAMYAGYNTRTLGRVRWRRLHNYVGKVLREFEIDATPATPVDALRPATQTMLAICRALHDAPTGSRTLILDEPTASLPAHESQYLLDALRRRADAGQSIVFVSHRLAEVKLIADDLTVLRDGEVAAVEPVNSVSTGRMAELMAGRPIGQLYPSGGKPRDDVAVEVRNLSARGLHDVSFDIKAGEILGIAGLLGSGRSSLLRTIFGDISMTSGTVRVGSSHGPFRDARAAKAAGIAYIPEDRHTDAAFPEHTVAENMSITEVRPYFKSFRYQKRTERDDCLGLEREFQIKSGGPHSPLASLSGGNQQKVILARWLRLSPHLILLDEPTQGVDVVARADIYRMIRDAAAAGRCVLIASSDFEELSRLCDRILLLSGGRISAEFDSADASPEFIFHAVQLHHEAGTK